MRLATFALLAAAMVWCGSAGANVVGTNIAMTMTPHYTGYSGNITNGVYSWNAYWCTYNANVSTPGFGWLEGIEWYCVDLRSASSGNSWDVYTTTGWPTPDDPMNYDGSWAGNTRAAWLVHENWNLSSNLDRAALQLAVWEALYDNGTTFSETGGSFKVLSGGNSTVFGRAADLYNASSERGIAYYADDSQNMMGGIPEPGTVLLLGIGLAGVGIGIARRRRQS